MIKTRLGKTNLMVTRTSFGALPLQRVSLKEADRILKKAYEAGINFFDTARSYTDSEEKIGYSLSQFREKIIIATKFHVSDSVNLSKDIEISLKNLKTDYIDIYQMHTPDKWPLKKDHDEILKILTDAKKAGKIRHIGMSNHNRDTAEKAIRSGLFETLQYPINMLSDERDLSVIDLCKSLDIGLIGMKALSGGLITNAKCAFSFLWQYENVVPIWGIQKMEELEEIISLDNNPPALTEEIMNIIKKDRIELSGEFCRACGYCMPCPVNIPINMAARMSLLLNRAPYQKFIEPDWQEKMFRIKDCLDCGECAKKCPYKLNTPLLLKKNLEYYEKFLKEKLN